MVYNPDCIQNFISASILLSKAQKNCKKVVKNHNVEKISPVWRLMVDFH